MREEILIAGSGIGGLTTALSLHQAGLPVRVFESVGKTEPLGVGINVLPHAVRELEELGLLPALQAQGVACRELVYCTKRGEPTWSEPRGLAAGYHRPQISIHRGTLQMLLLDATVERIGRDRIHLGHRVVGAENMRHGVRLSLEGPDGERLGDATGRLLVAADGIHSAVRRQFHPDEGAPSWNGAIMWRGMVEARPYLDGATMIMSHSRT